MEVLIPKAEKIRNLISEITFTKSEEIDYDTLLFDQGIFDSLGFLTLITRINDDYRIEVSDDELSQENFESINAIVAFIESKKESDL